jgi:hypothetical protein
VVVGTWSDGKAEVIITMQSRLDRVHPGAVGKFVDVIGLEGLQPVHTVFFFLFSLCIRPPWVMVNSHYWHVLLPVIATIEMGSYRMFFLVLMENRWLLTRLKMKHSVDAVIRFAEVS